MEQIVCTFMIIHIFGSILSRSMWFCLKARCFWPLIKDLDADKWQQFPPWHLIDPRVYLMPPHKGDWTLMKFLLQPLILSNQEIISVSFVSDATVCGTSCSIHIYEAYWPIILGLTHWPLADLSVILKMWYSVLLYWLVPSNLLLIMSSNECHRTLLMISQHWFR